MTTASAGGRPYAGTESSGSFKVPGGDNGIQEFGKEVAGSDLRQANEAVAALFRAVRSGHWNEVCSKYLSRQNVEAFKGIAKMSPHVKGASCPAGSAGSTRPAKSRLRQRTASARSASKAIAASVSIAGPTARATRSR